MRVRVFLLLFFRGGGGHSRGRHARTAAPHILIAASKLAPPPPPKILPAVRGVEWCGVCFRLLVFLSFVCVWFVASALIFFSTREKGRRRRRTTLSSPFVTRPCPPLLSLLPHAARHTGLRLTVLTTCCPPFPMQQLTVVSSHSETAALHCLTSETQKPPLLILHANGFGSALYVPMVNADLATHHTVYALDAPGQAASLRRAAPGTPGALAAYPHLALAAVDWLVGRGRVKNGELGCWWWLGQRERVCVAIDPPSTQPSVLYAFGHSGGGLAVILAALHRPGVFAGVYLYEPVVLPLPFLATTTLLVASARRRRATFASRDSAAAILASKPPMAGFDAAVLKAYVDTCLVEEDNESSPFITLATSPDNEAAVYNEAADLGATAWRGLHTLTTTPCTIAGSGDGGPLAQVAGEAAVEAGARSDTFRELTHLGPFEAPGMVAARVVVAFQRARL